MARMSLDRLGSHWLHPDRTLYGRPSFSVELLYARSDVPGFTWDDVGERVAMCRDKGVAVALRVDWRQRHVLPSLDDHEGVFDYVSACQQAVAQYHPDWLICGNETNLLSECNNEVVPAWWVARVVYGYGRPYDQTDNCFQFARTADERVEVLAPPVAPYSPDTSGIAEIAPPDGREMMAPWESYQYELARCCYDNAGHVPGIGEVKFAMHTYGRTGADGLDNGASEEPWTDVREGTYGAQFGSRWLQDALYLTSQGLLHSPYAVDYAPGGVLISESNTFTDALPCESYPAGWWQSLARYVNGFPNILGLACFVDQDYGGGWADCAMSTRKNCLADWDDDHNFLLEYGWQ